MAKLILCIFLLPLAACSLSVPQVTNASVVNGTLTYPGATPAYIGNTTSALNSAITLVFGSLHPPPVKSSAVLVNSSVGVLSYLTLAGTYVADAPLLIPAQFVLAMEDVVIMASPNFEGSAVIVANGSAYSAVVSAGGPTRALIDCSAATVAAPAVLALNSPFFLLDGVTVSSCGINGPAGTWTAGVHLHGSPFVTGGEVANCVIRDCSRAIWTETISGPVIRNSIVFNNSKHAIDFDAFSTHGIAFNNSAWDNGQEAVFIEQAASYITVSNNTLGPGNRVGVAVYNNDIETPTQGHVIVGNTIFGSLSAGISVGSTAPRAGAFASGVMVVGNVLYDNAGQGVHSNGGQTGTVYSGNADTDGMSLFTVSGAYFGNITAFDPLDRVHVAGL